MGVGSQELPCSSQRSVPGLQHSQLSSLPADSLPSSLVGGPIFFVVQSAGMRSPDLPHVPALPHRPSWPVHLLGARVGSFRVCGREQEEEEDEAPDSRSLLYLTPQHPRSLQG